MFLHILEAILNSLGLSPLALLAGGALFEGARDALKDMMKDRDPRNDFKKDLKDWVKNQFEDFMPGADELERIEKEVNQLLDDAKSVEENVFKPTGQAVGTALSDGQIQAQGDGGLGKTAEDFTQGGNIPGPPVGDLPGISTEQTGLSRSGGGASGGGSGSGGSGSSGGTSSGGTTPLGGSGSGTGASGSGTGTQPPTAGDLGIDPSTNPYIEYQPGQGQVQISYPDGTTETRPWPPA
jgi:hypothetical protein